MATNYENKPGGEGLGAKLKAFFTNRAVVVTLVTLLLAVGIIVAATVAANRSHRPLPGGDATGTEGASGTKPTGGLDVFKEEDTLPTFHGADTLDEAAGTSEPAALCMALPVTGQLIKGHDATLQVFSTTMGDYRIHLGVDIATAESAPVAAAADGTVTKIWQDPMMGCCVAVDHGDKTLSIYKNLSATLADGVAEGTTVKKGQQIATVGDSAAAEMAEEPHLHFEVTVNGLSVDPLTFFDAADVAAMQDPEADDAFEETAAGK